MPKYRKKPVEIEAVQWKGNNQEEVFAFLGYHGDVTIAISTPTFFYNPSNGLWLLTLEGQLRASKNDYIIKGVKGEFYACKPDIFLMTYDKVDE